MVHAMCFPDYFLTKLDGGKGKVLYSLYECSIGENRILITAKDDNKIIGFVMGYVLPNNPRKILVRKHFWLLVRRMLILLLKFDKMAWSRVGKIISGMFRKKARGNDSNQEEAKRASLLSICVLPEYRGQNISSELIRRFEEGCKDNQVTYYTLSVFKSNKRANAFYEKMGLKVIGQGSEEYHYSKELNYD